MDDFSQQARKTNLSFVILSAGIVLAVGAAVLGFMFMSKSEKVEPTLVPVPTMATFVPSPMPVITEPSGIGASTERALSGYYKASMDGHIGVIMDEWFTRTLADYVNGRMLAGGLAEEDWLHLNQAFAWEIMDISAVEDSNFQVAFIKITPGSEVNCERVELADPENTGDHWRISRVSAVSCEDFGLVEKIPTPTAKPAVFVPDMSWVPCPGSYTSRLTVGMTAAVSFTPPVPNRVRDDAGSNFTIRGEMDPGEQMWIIDGPKCADGWVWWRVRSQYDGLEGWTSEGEQPIGEDPIYWLEPTGVYK